MATYNDKKKLIEDNSDLYISEYDKTLDATSLSGIISAKRKYQEAKNAGNTQAMNAANQKANTIRQSAGSYEGGFDGSEYNRTPKQYEVRIDAKYSSPYDGQKKRITSLISDMDDFSYKPENDPIFKTYRDLYTKLGNEAYERALAKNSLRTGGVTNSSAISAAMQAQNQYNTMISAKIPELYEAAYEKYSDEYERLYNQLKLVNELDNTEYSRYRDTVSDFESDRKYYSDKDQAMAKLANDQYEFDSRLEYDIIKDAQDMEYQKAKDMQDIEYKKSKDLSEYYRWYEEMQQAKRSDTLNAAINLAKVLYGKVPISNSVVRNLIATLE